MRKDYRQNRHTIRARKDSDRNRPYGRNRPDRPHGRNRPGSICRADRVLKGCVGSPADRPQGRWNRPEDGFIDPRTGEAKTTRRKSLGAPFGCCPVSTVIDTNRHESTVIDHKGGNSTAGLRQMLRALHRRDREAGGSTPTGVSITRPAKRRPQTRLPSGSGLVPFGSWSIHPAGFRRL